MATSDLMRSYFALQASKSHEYPIKEMNALPIGEHSRTMVLCKVAKGNAVRTKENMDKLDGSAPAGYHSVHGIAAPDGPLNYDELVVFAEEAILPYAVVTYRFLKRADGVSGGDEMLDEAGGARGGPTDAGPPASNSDDTELSSRPMRRSATMRAASGQMRPHMALRSRLQRGAQENEAAMRAWMRTELQKLSLTGSEAIIRATNTVEGLRSMNSATMVSLELSQADQREMNDVKLKLARDFKTHDEKIKEVKSTLQQRRSQETLAEEKAKEGRWLSQQEKFDAADAVLKEALQIQGYEDAELLEALSSAERENHAAMRGWMQQMLKQLSDGGRDAVLGAVDSVAQLVSFDASGLEEALVLEDGQQLLAVQEILAARNKPVL